MNILTGCRPDPDQKNPDDNRGFCAVGGDCLNGVGQAGEGKIANFHVKNQKIRTTTGPPSTLTRTCLPGGLWVVEHNHRTLVEPKFFTGYMILPFSM